jgi:hypothetical protein
MKMCRSVLHYKKGYQQAATVSWHSIDNLEKVIPCLMQVHARHFCSQDAKSEAVMLLHAANKLTLLPMVFRQKGPTDTSVAGCQFL